ncbi:AAA family ATPase [Polyangium aurulentum]|uniref:AAA family ATPase n=1 Tax=Polyangium aurulentum TaxID=2567896 RepID=UPI0019811867|nr:AAA family ATPase [Polyangium aurulentum]UQA63892.1 ATP-binding protein [Polyangium aurulentum]
MHYMLPAAQRLPQARELVERMGYFVVHAPRQTGKTTALASLAAELTASGRFASVLFSCESGEAAGDDLAAAQRMMLSVLRDAAKLALPPELQPPAFPDGPDGTLLCGALTAWARACPRPLVLIFDEIDALRGKSLLSVLRQLRSAYASRPESFPWSVILCGLRDVRDYKAASGGDPGRLGTASPFNIKVASLRIGDFSAAEVHALYAQHTAETGQPFTEEAVARAFELTAGQPWLVNALGREIVDGMKVPESEPITAEHMDVAKERLILARATHLDARMACLHEPHVMHVVETLIAGGIVVGDDSDDGVADMRALGLLAPDSPLRIANPIYREVIVRVLAAYAEDAVTAEPRSFILADGRLDLPRLLEEFAAFWGEHGEVLTSGQTYHEVAPQLVLMAFLQRVVNGGGYVDREYGVGRGRIDVLVRFPYRGAGGERLVQREALELKVWRAGEADPLGKGLAQIDGYLERLGLDTGTLVIFDRRPERSREVRFEEAKTPSGRVVRLMRA